MPTLDRGKLWYFKRIERLISIQNVYLSTFSGSNMDDDKAELLTYRVTCAKKQNHQADTSELEDEIDKLVYKLYDLTPAEIKIIEGNIEGAYKSTLKK